MTHIPLGILGIILLLNSLDSKMDFLNITAPYKNYSVYKQSTKIKKNKIK